MCEYVFYCIRYEYSSEREKRSALCVLLDESTRALAERLDAEYGYSVRERYMRLLVTTVTITSTVIVSVRITSCKRCSCSGQARNHHFKSNKMAASVDPIWLSSPVRIHKMANPMVAAPNQASPTCAGPRCAEIPNINPCTSHWPPASDHSVFFQAPFPPPSTLARSSSIHTYPRPCTPI